MIGSRVAVANAELRFPLWGAFGGDAIQSHAWFLNRSSLITDRESLILGSVDPWIHGSMDPWISDSGVVISDQ